VVVNPGWSDRQGQFVEGSLCQKSACVPDLEDHCACRRRMIVRRVVATAYLIFLQRVNLEFHCRVEDACGSGFRLLVALRAAFCGQASSLEVGPYGAGWWWGGASGRARRRVGGSSIGLGLGLGFCGEAGAQPAAG